MEYTPPYMHQGLYDLETRKLIEAPNRATIAAIFERRKEERRAQEWRAKVKAAHDRGIHFPGFCPFCPENFYYD